ncbi:unnamed protein product [Trichobilharzia regenti]|nr:unnamed protein product [Trichobilharzia regenti]
MLLLSFLLSSSNAHLCTTITAPPPTATAAILSSKFYAQIFYTIHHHHMYMLHYGRRLYPADMYAIATNDSATSAGLLNSMTNYPPLVPPSIPA